MQQKPYGIAINPAGGVPAGAAGGCQAGRTMRFSVAGRHWSNPQMCLGASVRVGSATNRLVGPWTGSLCLWLLALGLASPAWAQTGAYTLNSGTANLSSLTENATSSNESGIFVYNSGSLTVGTVNVTTSGNSTNGTTSDQYGGNAGILAGTTGTKGTINITGSSNSVVTTGAVANGLFATYTGSSVTMLGGTIICSGDNAHGVDATYGGAVTLSNVNVTSYGQNSSAVATDYGGGTVLVTGGTIIASNTVNGGHSAGVYSTGTITVKNATVTSKGDNGGVIDGANAIILTNTTMSGVLNGIKIHNTAGASGSATITLSGGSLTGTGGDALYLNGTDQDAVTATITVLSNAAVTGSSGNLLNLDGGSTGTFTASAETLSGNVVASGGTNVVYLTLQNGTSLTGAINTARQLTIDSTSAWTMTSNSAVILLTNSGTLNLTGKLTCTNVVVKSGGTFGGAGTLSSNLTVNSGATLILNSTTNFVVGGNVIFGGAVTVKPSTTNISAGTYTLLTYSNSLSGTPTFTYSAPSGSGQTAVFSTATAKVVTVTISAPPSVPTGLTATAGDAQVTLGWNAATNASGYNVKRSLTSGGSYTVIATNLARLAYTNTGLADGTLYYYVVSATNATAESANSTQVSARPVSATSPEMTLVCTNAQLALAWPADHTGWLLEGQTNALGQGLGTNWVRVSNSDTNNQITVPMVTTNGSVFFRLVRP